MEVDFPERSFQDHDNNIANMRSAVPGGKRKRDSFDHDDATVAPNARKPTTSTYPDNTLPAPTANMSDATSDYLNQHHNQEQFDLSALQSQSQDDSSLQPQDGYGQTTNNSGVNIDTATAALRYNMSVPSHTSESFLPSPNAAENENGAYNLDSAHTAQADLAGLDTSAAAGDLDPVSDEGGAGSGAGGSKPNPGTDDWHKVRKDNHKEVERRRRETINEGINELAKIVPGSEKNKGAILSRAVAYIQKLQDDGNQNIDKWTFEKLVTEQAINSLSEKLNRAWNEKEFWKRVARDQGVDMDAADANLAIELEAQGNADAANAAAAASAAANGDTVVGQEGEQPQQQQQSTVESEAIHDDHAAQAQDIQA